MNNEVRVRCTKDGISVEGARDIGSTSDTRAGSLSQFLRIAECWWFTYCEKSPGQEADCYGNAGAARRKCPTALLSLDEAIAHAEDCADDTPCGKNHRQLADWLKELRSLRHCNSAAMREALEAIDKNTDLLDIAEDIAPKLHPSHSFVAVQIRKIVRAAFSEPPRNCDVGTAEEQDARFVKWRYSNPLRAELGLDALAWAQMPYEPDTKNNGGNDAE